MLKLGLMLDVFEGNHLNIIDICHLCTKEVLSTAANIRKSHTKLIGLSSSKKQQTLSLNVDKSNKQCTLENSLRASQKSFQQT